MSNPERQEFHEAAQENITEAEQKIIHSLTAQDIERVGNLLSDNLTKERAGIVGVRSEDLLFLLDGVHKGYIPVGESGMMAKGEPSHYYLTPNPESSVLGEHHPEVLKTCTAETFRELTQQNLDHYSKIAIKQAVDRNLVSRLGENARQKLFRDLRRFYEDEFYSDDLYLEEFYKHVTTEVRRNPNVIQFNSRSRPALHFLWQHLQEALPPEEVNRFLRSLSARGGIALAFNERIFEKHQYLPGTGDFGRDEIVFDVPSGKLDLDTIAGFEPLGDFEDSVLERIGVRKPQIV